MYSNAIQDMSKYSLRSVTGFEKALSSQLIFNWRGTGKKYSFI